MSLSRETKKGALLLATAFALFATNLPGHRPWSHGWEVLLGGLLVHYFAVGLLGAIAHGGYRVLRRHVVPSGNDKLPFQVELQGDEVLAIVCVTLLATSCFVLLADAGVFAGLAELSGHDGPAPR